LFHLTLALYWILCPCLTLAVEQADRPFEFPDYADLSLLRILMAKARRDSLKLELGVAKRAVASLAGASARPHFGNAGAVDSLLSEAKLRLQQRGGGGDVLTIADFLGAQPDDGQEADGASAALLRGMVGFDGIMAKLEGLRATVEFARLRGDDPRGLVGFNYLFVGAPGTGKTTVARRMGGL
jgi:hypothetical protein